MSKSRLIISGGGGGEGEGVCSVSSSPEEETSSSCCTIYKTSAVNLTSDNKEFLTCPQQCIIVVYMHRNNHLVVLRLLESKGAKCFELPQ
jgi:hypothetical protein